ncbi:hypothetical protein [Enterococcus faecalis]|uniref:DUF6874 family protein n=1 Tax=Enterococcus faecalis TaxID=1351 RepID=UPI0004A6B0E1|nr:MULTISPECIES: hypothetical protein [Bacteria]EJG3828636.1 hypothetical protein [Listeria monocytogenes]MDU6989854.1 hypothetical protein [Escherichia coli]EGO2601790.1 hypothetical protein [Enterococcus faecalis]EGO7961107.1 hypothetical protein [Enterococcus faecalis]EGO8497468.1 hypothetical protein [Enterococcus faecalis]
MTREELSYMFKITERAEELGIMIFDRISLKMDLEIANKQFDLRLKDLLDADDFNFSHDIVGIQNYIDRETKQFTELFLPRFASSNI